MPTCLKRGSCIRRRRLYGEGSAASRPLRRGRRAGPARGPTATASAVLVVRLALLDEGGHALLAVLGRERRVEQAALEPHALGERRLERAVHRLLGHHR